MAKESYRQKINVEIESILDSGEGLEGFKVVGPVNHNTQGFWDYNSPGLYLGKIGKKHYIATRLNEDSTGICIDRISRSQGWIQRECVTCLTLPYEDRNELSDVVILMNARGTDIARELNEKMLSLGI